MDIRSSLDLNCSNLSEVVHIIYFLCVVHIVVLVVIIYLYIYLLLIYIQIYSAN